MFTLFHLLSACFLINREAEKAGYDPAHDVGTCTCITVNVLILADIKFGSSAILTCSTGFKLASLAFTDNFHKVESAQ
jgi:hypothetical protein